MESVSLYDYKEALLQAAWETGVRYMSTDEWGSSGLAEKPLVNIEVSRKDEAEQVKKAFVEAFVREAGEQYLINVRPLARCRVLAYSHVFVKDGEWVDCVS